MSLPDFDTLLQMAQQEPERLEQLRQQKSQELIEAASASSQRRLRGLQFQIDAQRQLSECALGACIRISKMMHESLMQLPSLLSQLDDSLAGQKHSNRELSTAEVIELPLR